MDESITIILFSLAELCLVASGLAIFFYFRSKKYKIESLNRSTPKEIQAPSDKSTIHGYFHEQVQKLQLLLKDDFVDTKTAIDARIKILKNESMLLTKDNIDYEQQLKFYQKILASITAITEEPAAEQNSNNEAVGSDDTLFELDELEIPNSPVSEESADIITADIPIENTDENIDINNPFDGDSNEILHEEELDVVAKEHDFSTAAADEFELADEESFETIEEDEFELADEESFEIAAENEFEVADEESFETIEEDEFEVADEESFEIAAENEFEVADEDEFAINSDDDSEFVAENENEEFDEEVVSKEAPEITEEDNYSEDIPILQDTIELDAPLITGELKNESAEIGKIRNIVGSLHATIEELKQFSDEQDLDTDADEYLTTKLEEIEISNARLNLCTETLERDNARLLELVNQKEEEPQETENTDSEKNSVEVIPEKDRKEKIELLEVELSSLEKRLDDKTNRLDNLQSEDTGLPTTEDDDNTETFNQLMREIDNLTELLTVKSEELSKLRVHAIDPEDEIDLQKDTGT